VRRPGAPDRGIVAGSGEQGVDEGLGLERRQVVRPLPEADELHGDVQGPLHGTLALNADGTFRAATVLAKHDENYMPKEVADALKAAGHWQGGKAAGTAPK